MTGPGSTGEDKVPVRNLEVKVCGGSVFVDGFIMNSPCTFTIDTGADVTIISHRVYINLINVKELQPPEINELLYRVRKSNRDKPRVIHRNRLWRFTTEN